MSEYSYPVSHRRNRVEACKGEVQINALLVCVKALNEKDKFKADWPKSKERRVWLEGEDL